jgi:hypothetical protein
MSSKKSNNHRRLDVYTYHDEYYYYNFCCIDFGLESVKKALVQPIEKIPGIEEAIKNPYEIFFASNTLHTIPANDLRSQRERCSPKALTLGKEIQHIFVYPENLEVAQTFIDKNGLKNRVSASSVEGLLQAAWINQQATSYFADIFSLKKMKKKFAVIE